MELAEHAVDGSQAFSKAQFVAGALAELSVALCRGVAGMYKASLQQRTRAGGRRYFKAAAVPFVDG